MDTNNHEQKQKYCLLLTFTFKAPAKVVNIPKCILFYNKSRSSNLICSSFVVRENCKEIAETIENLEISELFGASAHRRIGGEKKR